MKTKLTLLTALALSAFTASTTAQAGVANHMGTFCTSTQGASFYAQGLSRHKIKDAASALVRKGFGGLVHASFCGAAAQDRIGQAFVGESVGSEGHVNR